MRCTQITEPAESPRHTWHDNFLCVPPQAPFQFSWSYAGPIPGLRCLRFNEPADPHTWQDNFLCWSRSAECRRRNGPFAWSCDGPVAGLTCTAGFAECDGDEGRAHKAHFKALEGTDEVGDLQVKVAQTVLTREVRASRGGAGDPPRNHRRFARVVLSRQRSQLCDHLHHPRARPEGGVY